MKPRGFAPFSTTPSAIRTRAYRRRKRKGVTAFEERSLHLTQDQVPSQEVFAIATGLDSTDAAAAAAFGLFLEAPITTSSVEAGALSGQPDHTEAEKPDAHQRQRGRLRRRRDADDLNRRID